MSNEEEKIKINREEDIGIDDIINKEFADLKIELMDNNIDKDYVSAILERLASDCFILHSQINKDK